RFISTNGAVMLYALVLAGLVGSFFTPDGSTLARTARVTFTGFVAGGARLSLESAVRTAMTASELNLGGLILIAFLFPPAFTIAARFVIGASALYATGAVRSPIFGNNALGVVLAATIGVCIVLPTLFEIPLTLGLMMLGLGWAPAASLLFAAASAGPLKAWH